MVRRGRLLAAAALTSVAVALTAIPGAATAATPGLVIAPTADELPATCTSVVELSDQDGTAAIRSIGGPAGPTIDGRGASVGATGVAGSAGAVAETTAAGSATADVGCRGDVSIPGCWMPGRYTLAVGVWLPGRVSIIGVQPAAISITPRIRLRVRRRRKSVCIRNTPCCGFATGSVEQLHAGIEGRDLGSVVAEIKARLLSDPLPDGYSVVFGGQYQNQQRAMRSLVLATLIALFVVYMLLFAALRSASDAFVILATLPDAFVGGILALLITGESLNVSSGVGFVALFGIAVQNGLVLLTQTRDLESQGVPKEEAVRQASIARLRPKLMTALCAALGVSVTYTIGDTEIR